MAEKIDKKTISYMLGILSIVFAFFEPFAGLVLGIIGLTQSKKHKVTEARKFNIIGIVLSVIFIVISIIILITSLAGGLGGLFSTI